MRTVRSFVEADFCTRDCNTTGASSYPSPCSCDGFGSTTGECVLACDGNADCSGHGGFTTCKIATFGSYCVP